MEQNLPPEQSTETPEIKRCTRCGRDNPVDSTYCSWCYLKLAPSAAEAQHPSLAPRLVALTTVAVLAVLAIIALSLGWIPGPPAISPALAGIANPSDQPAAPTAPPIPTAPIVLANGPPSDVHAFADYIELAHPNVGNRPLAFTGKDANYVGGDPQIFLGLGPSSVDYMLYDANRADVRAWGDAVAADAKKAWPDQDYSVVLDWTYYTEETCSGCEGYCQFQSPTFTAGKGWFHAEIAVNIFRISNSELVIACAGK